MNKLRSRAVALALVVAAIGLGAYLFQRWRSPQPTPYRGGQPPARPPSATTTDDAISLSPRVAADQIRASLKTANVVICVLDAARADHFGAYGYPRETTPNFDRLARQSVVFDQHFSQYPQTSPSTATLFTSQYPDTHGVAVPRTQDSKERLRPLDPGAFTIDLAMGNAGFRTSVFTSTPAAAGVLRLGANSDLLFTPMGMVRSKEDDALWRSPDHLLDLIRENLRAEPRFFSYIHFLPPHNPYEAPENLKKLFQGKLAPGYWEGEPAFTHVYDRFHDQDPPATGSDWVNLYDANLRWADYALGELVSYLKRIGVFDNTLLIVTADHGEALGEHKYQWHATCPYGEALHIPLLIRFPGAKQPIGRIGALTETIDIMPTILDLFGVRAPADTLQGKSLVPLLTGETTKLRDYAFTRTNGRYPCYVVQNHRWSLLLYQGGKMRALYDLQADPYQTHNVIAEHPKEASDLTKVFVDFAETQQFLPLDFVDPHFRTLTMPAAPGAGISDEARRKLRSLGYVD